jgi:hypothetical protein
MSVKGFCERKTSSSSNLSALCVNDSVSADLLVEFAVLCNINSGISSVAIVVCSA